VKRRIVVTGCSGDDWKQLSRETRKTVELYCSRHGVDFVFEELISSGRAPSWFKLVALASCLATHDEALWLDADVIACEDAANIFDAVPDEAPAAACLVNPRNEESHFNCGVLLVRRAFLPVLVEAAMQDDLIHHRWWEQAAINRLAFDRIFQLPDQWNVWSGTTSTATPMFRHACGLGDPEQRRRWLFGGNR